MKNLIIPIIKNILSFLLKGKYILLGKKIRIGKGAFINYQTKLDGYNLINDYSKVISCKLGEHSYVSPMSILINVDIGKYCSIGPGCMIGLGTHPIDHLSTSPSLYNFSLSKDTHDSDFKKTIISHDVWIGANVSILSGLTIGTGAVIGAGAIVTKNIPPYAIAVGNPARIIRKRFSEEEIELLLASNWWEKDINEIKNQYKNRI
ncbi:CatB-related O-acetyltransferase [Providencia rettgeri]|uniref:CatB-related O-acetyltransferase n=1 Tax=Providencia rettgeri TaxID=587 RepID=UPI00384B3187